MRRLVCILAIGGLGLSPSASANESRRSPIVRAVEQAAPSVVNIHGRKTLRSEQGEISPSGEREVNGMGTGVVIDERGYILTNYHVVEGVARIQVTLWDGRTLVGRIIAHDTKTDLAVIKIDVPERIPVIRLGTSSDLMIGESVIAVGNAYGYENTVTRGIISALHRPVQVSDTQKYHDLIQTDASINPGNSGGPLMNIEGNVIGINVAVRVGAQGIGFAIPIDEALEIAADLMSSDRVAHVSHGVLGDTERLADTSHFRIQSVEKDSPAEVAGIQSGDVVLDIEGQEVLNGLDFQRFLLGRTAGENVTVRVQRGEQQQALTLALGRAEEPKSSVASRTWDVLGLRLAAIPSTTLRQVSQRYRGGLKVVAVRADGPAANQGIRPGDILVGMHKWETASLDNVAYILNSEELPPEDPIKFYILRGTETLYGHLQLTMKPTR